MNLSCNRLNSLNNDEHVWSNSMKEFLPVIILSSVIVDGTERLWLCIDGSSVTSECAVPMEAAGVNSMLLG